MIQLYVSHRSHAIRYFSPRPCPSELPSHVICGVDLLAFPEEVDRLAIQPLLHFAVHAGEQLATRSGKIEVNPVTKASLSGTEVLVAGGDLLQLLLGEDGSSAAIGGDHLVLLVEQLDVLCLPLPGLGVLLAEEDEATVAINVELGGFGVGGSAITASGGVELEAVRDGGLHLADGTVVVAGQLDQSAALTVHDENALLLASLGDSNEVVDRLGAAPG